MAYGTPGSESDIEPYLADIQHGRPLNQTVLDDLKMRYRSIGGHSPLLEITKAQAAELQKALKSYGVQARVYIGMRHWHPYIREVVPQILKEGCSELTALVLAPHYSEMSIGAYRRALEEALPESKGVLVDFVESWHDNPVFHQAVAEKIKDALHKFPVTARVEIIFTAHSLPERILQENNPYPSQLRASCQAVADLLKLDHWGFAYQSAGQTGEKWLGPDILEALEEIAQAKPNGGHVLVVPIGFVADHLETLYDIDIEAQEFAKNHGLDLKRTKSMNASPTFITALADVVRKRHLMQ